MATRVPKKIVREIAAGIALTQLPSYPLDSAHALFDSKFAIACSVAERLGLDPEQFSSQVEALEMIVDIGPSKLLEEEEA